MAKRPAEYLIQRRWTVDVARAALSALADSGLSVAAFAAREGLDAQRLYGWRRRLGPPESVSPSFVEVTAAIAPMEIVLRSGHVVRLSPSFDAAALVRLLEVLEETPAC
jgi:transposase-like protein